MCLYPYIVSNIKVLSEIQTYKLNLLGLRGKIVGRGKNMIIRTHNGCDVPFEYPECNLYNTFVFYYFCIFYIFMTIVPPFVT
jgi:hypothetical protein